LAEAERLYRAAIAIDPGHFRSLYYLGIVALQTGRHQVAVDSMTRALAQNDGVAEVHYNLAVALQGLQRIADAAAHYETATRLKPDYADAHTNLGNMRMELGRYPEALADYERAVALQGPSPSSQYNIANVLVRLERPAEAEAHYRAAIASKPDFAEAYNNFGSFLKDQERLDEAEAAYARALALRPDYPDAHNNIGSVMAARGETDAAIRHYRDAVRLNPRFVQAHVNLGIALMRSGHVDAAVAEFRQALIVDPGDLDATHNLARGMFQLGEVGQAVAELKRALDRNGNAETKSLFTRYVRGLPTDQIETVRDDVGRALTEGWARSNRLEPAAIALIKRRSEIGALLEQLQQKPTNGASSPQTASVLELPLSAVARLAEDPLLIHLMILACVSDPELETILTAVRRGLLGAAEDRAETPPPEILKFFCALAHQCFFNEYVFAETEDESARAGRLRDALVGRLQAGEDIPVLWPIAVAAYMPLHRAPGADALLLKTWPEPIRHLVKQQVAQPREERTIGAALKSVTTIDDEISLKVQEQYEENPYPRWELPPVAIKPASFDQHLRAKFPLAPYRLAPRSGPIEFLIAGCGTGIHAIESFRMYAGVRMLAIDLSRASLAYAARKSRELDLPIAFAQADILKLGDLGRSFDVIEAAGSLQCLVDPAAGWRVLLSRLKPGGVMILGLYSKQARAAVNAVRAYIAERHYRGTPMDIRRCRQELFAFPAGSLEHSVTLSQNFYAMSECRDLLFHVQEYQHTLPEIKAFLAAENLQFLGFDADPWILRLYGERNPGDPAMIDLDAWAQFESDIPWAFAAMYQFFVQKR
jgi:tetratricopeptide (TPR) repeat protein/SAM-dependent methyltransferase